MFATLTLVLEGTGAVFKSRLSLLQKRFLLLEISYAQLALDESHVLPLPYQSNGCSYYVHPLFVLRHGLRLHVQGAGRVFSLSNASGGSLVVAVRILKHGVLVV